MGGGWRSTGNNKIRWAWWRELLRQGRLLHIRGNFTQCEESMLITLRTVQILKEYSPKKSEVVEDHIFSTVSYILQIHKCSLKLLMEFRICYPKIWHFDVWNILNWRNFRNSRYKNSNLYLRKVIRSSCETNPPDTLRKGTSLPLKVDRCWGIWDNRMAKLSPGYYS